MRTSFWLLFLLLVAGVALGVVRGNDPYIGLLGVPDVVTFTATPAEIVPGQAVKLDWKTRGAASITIDFGPPDQSRSAYEHHANLPPTGSLVVKPKVDSVFVMGCDTALRLDCQPHIISVHVNGATTGTQIEARR